MFEEMPDRSGISTRLSTLLRRCGAHSSIGPGRQAHAQSLTRCLQSDPTLQADLILMYSRCSRPHISRQLFDRMLKTPPLFSWNLLFSSYVKNQLPLHSLSLFPLLLRSQLLPDHFTLPSLFKACTFTKAFAFGLALHGIATSLGLDNHVIVRTSILDMYVKSDHITDARKLFSGGGDTVIWNSIVTGLARAGTLDDTLDLFRLGHADAVAFPSVLGACGRSGDRRRGKEIHGRAIRRSMLDRDTAIGNALIDMYAKCGSVSDSSRVFSTMADRNIVTWSSMISCYGVHGRGREALGIYNEMVEKGFVPNSVTFTSVLSGCSHSGLVNDAHKVFESMTRVYGVEPSVEHYACMVDLLGRAGRIEEALGVVERMPMEAGASVWGALLGACVVHRCVGVAEIAASKVFELEPGNSSNYVALCGVYEMVGMWDDVARMRARMREMDMAKKPGCSWINMEGRVHAFYQGNACFPSSQRVYEALDGLRKNMELSTTRLGAFLI